jgi:hypothetical protein
MFCCGSKTQLRDVIPQTHVSENTIEEELNHSRHGSQNHIEMPSPLPSPEPIFVNPTYNLSPELWEEDFFRKFEWLKRKNTLNDEENILEDNQTDISKKDVLEEANQMSFYGQATNLSVDEWHTKPEKLSALRKICEMMKNAIDTYDENTGPLDDPNQDVGMRTLYLYFVALEEDKMLLHASFKRSFVQVLADCEIIYDFAKRYKPRRVVHVMENVDTYEADKQVKIFMNMFGIDDTRGGSYRDIVLQDQVKDCLEAEFRQSSLQHYLDQEKRLNQ